MTIVLQRSNEGSDSIFFDAVLTYSCTYNSKLSSHPIDGNSKDGAYRVTDHVTLENPTFQLKGVISGADFGAGRPSASEYPLANTVTISEYASVKSASDNLLNKVTGSFLPFGQNAEPEVSVGSKVSTSLQMIKNMLISMRDNREVLALVEFTNGVPIHTELDLIITQLQFNEDEKSGDALYVDMTFEKPKFVDLAWTTTPVKASNTSGKTKDAAQAVINKGNQSAPTQKTILQGIAEDLSVEDLLKYREQIVEALKRKMAGAQ
jgi:hypothetical protein